MSEGERSSPAAEARARYERLCGLIRLATARTLKQPSLVRVEPPALVVGDLHGDLDSLKAAVECALRKKVRCIVFLGDYVDRGPHQLEVLETLLSLFVKPPSGLSVVLLRGNHETPSVNRDYGFLEELKRKLPAHHEVLYERFNKFFATLPYAALTRRYLLLHGGLPRGIERAEELTKLRKPLLEPEPGTPEFEILWNDPGEFIEGFIPGVRGEGSLLFGKDVTQRFLKASNLKGLIRSHEPPGAAGFGYAHDRLVLTVFTCRYYGVTPAVALIRRQDGDEAVEVLSL